MLEWIQEGRRGPWAVEHFEIDKHAAALYAIGCYGSYEIPPRAGKYTRLIHDERGVVMSDTRQEMYDLYTLEEGIRIARAHPRSTFTAHVNGLGLGIFIKHLLEECFTVEVIEIDPDVIELVGSQLLRMFPHNLTIVQADALEWRPPKNTRYGVVWHDIWDEGSLDNLPEYKLLLRRYGHYANWQGAWARDHLKREQRRENAWTYVR